jgi:FkbM family methyltransferase
MEKNSYSQFNQDINVLNFYNKKRNGFFLDIGAYNGVDMSNTYLFEKQYDWKGVCFEPLVDMFKKLAEARTAICCNKALYTESNKKVKFSCCDLLSGITDNIDKYNWVKDSESYEVDTIRLDDFMIENENIIPKFIEYMSLDTEGTEFDILKTIDFNKYRIGYITVEHNFVEPKRQNMRNFLLSKGYLYFGENSVDDDYVHKSLIEGIYYYNNDMTKPIILNVDNLTNKVTVTSKYWAPDRGIIDGVNKCIRFQNLGVRSITHNMISMGDHNIWKRA